MFPTDDRRPRRSDRPRRRPDRIAVEGLETRQLMAYSPFGYSLPQLSVFGYAAPEAAYGGPLAVDVTVENQGASSLIEPLNIAPGIVDPVTGATSPTRSTADSTPTTVQVFASPRPGATSGLVQVGTIAIPVVRQNSDYEVVSTITLPARPAGFPANGGKVYLTLVLDNSQSVLQADTSGNIFRVPHAVRIVNPLPDLKVVAFDIPSALQPGDVISPTIRIGNFGAGNPASQGPVVVDLVASLDRNFGPGDSIVGSYVINSLPGISGVPTRTGYLGDENLIPPANINTTTVGPLKLPTTPGTYFLGIVIDPANAIKMTYAPTPALMGVIQVGPRDPFLPPANLLVTTNGIVPVFPNLPSTVIPPPASTAPFTPFFPNPPSPTGPSLLPIPQGHTVSTASAHRPRKHPKA